MESIPVPIKLQKNLVVTQSNQLTEARYTLTVAEQRLVLTLLSFISPDDEDFKDYEIKISDFKNLLDSNSNTIYESVREALRKISSRVIYIPSGKKGYEMINWFSYARYDEENHSITIRFDKALKPYLLQLKEQFTQYRLFTITQFQSIYTIRIYMLLKQYEKIGFREISLVDFRYILDIEDGKYSEFKELRKWVINKTKKELEKKDENGHLKSDITFDLETIRGGGRKITRLRFNIRKQKYQEQLPFDIPEVEAPSPAVQALVDHKISENLARKFEAEQGESEILRCIAKYEDRVKAGKVADMNGGYLLEMLKGRAGKQGKAEQEAEEKARKLAEEATQRAAEEKRKEQEEKARKQAIKEFLAGCDDARMLEITRAFEDSEIFARNLKISPFLYELYKNTGVKDMTIKSMFHRFIHDEYL